MPAAATAKIEYGPSIALRPVPGPVRATVEVPGSKSITNRALLLAGLARGQSELIRPLFSDDTRHMIDALRLLGAQVHESADRMVVEGVDFQPTEPAQALFIGNSGTCVRFLAAACVHIPHGRTCVLDGVPRMRRRPIQDLLDALGPLGGHAASIAGDGCPPVRVDGGGLNGGETSVRGDISSQYLSALMMSAPGARTPVTIHVAGHLVSRPYVAMTASIMERFGATCRGAADSDELFIEAPTRYVATRMSIEPDASNASYFLAAAAVTGGAATVVGLTAESVQGDVRFARMLEKTGCTAIYAPDGITVVGPERLAGVDVDMTLMPDMAQSLAVVCLFAHGRSVIRGLQTLRVKETDRIEAVAAELRKLGAQVEAGDDYWLIDPPRCPVASAAIATYDDHRMAMAFAVAGLRVDGGLTVEDPGCVSKTFPDFWRRWNEAFYPEGGRADG